MAAVTICSDFGAPKNKVWHGFHCFPIYFPWSDGTGCHDLKFYECWVLSQLFYSPFLPSSAIRVVSSAYLRLLVFLLTILFLACATSSPAFLMMYSAYKLNKQGDNIQPWHTPFSIWNQSVVPCPVLFPDLHTGFSRGRSGDLVFPSPSEFSTVYCDPHSQRLWHSQ